MDIRSLSPVIGAEITGVDLSKPFSDAQREAVLDVFKKHHLLLFRNVEIDNDQQKRFAEYFGPTIPTHKTRADGQMFISNKEMGSAVGDGTLPFHSDHTYFEHPDTSALLLYALEIPSSGGHTIWANTIQAYEDLPHDLRARMVGKTAMHRSTARTTGNFEWVQPLGRYLPDLKKPVVFASQFCKDGIVELPGAEGNALLDEIFAYLYRPEFLYEHTWTVNDLIIWNNRILQHARTNFDMKQPRTLRRSTLGVPEDVIEAQVEMTSGAR